MKNLFIITLMFMFLSSFTGSNNEFKNITLDGSEVLWEADSHNFGEIPQNKPVSVDFKFTNTGDSPLVITEVKTSCGCTASNYPKTAIQPGKTSKITVDYNAKKLGVFSKTISVVTNADEQTKTLYIKGTVIE